MDPKQYAHVIRVSYKDTDQMGVAHHGNYVSWFEIARTEMMRNDGIAYKDMEDLGLLLPVLEMNIQYRKPAHYDDEIEILSTISNFSAARLEFSYEVRRKMKAKDGNNASELLATGTSLHMWLNNNWKPARLHKIAPDIFRRLKDIYGEQ